MANKPRTTGKLSIDQGFPTGLVSSGRVPSGTVARMFGIWLAVVFLDGVLAATLVPSNTAGYLSLAGTVAVVLWTWIRHSNPEPRTISGSQLGGD